MSGEKRLEWKKAMASMWTVAVDTITRSQQSTQPLVASTLSGKSPIFRADERAEQREASEERF
ncbi:hypothetical protein BG842_16390 [Haladaptatus sp. W1]|nr:hypothetical protein BG842_16390 [Haladaptatus sp. W1]